MINIATDGACKGNPGPGGWGVAIFRDCEFEDGLYGGDDCTTNNRMEMQAFISACRIIESEELLDEDDITFMIDSTYVLKGITEWLPGWIAKDFKKVKNVDLWKEIMELEDIWMHCSFKWVKGHSGDLFNEKADELANKGCL